MSYPQHYLLWYISYWLHCLWSFHGLAHSLGLCLRRRHRRLSSYHLQTTDQPGLQGTCITHLLAITLGLFFKEQWKWRPCMINCAFSCGSCFFLFQLINWHVKACVALLYGSGRGWILWQLENSNRNAFKCRRRENEAWERLQQRSFGGYRRQSTVCTWLTLVSWSVQLEVT